MLTTETFGRLNLGAKREQAANGSVSANAIGNSRFSMNILLGSMATWAQMIPVIPLDSRPRVHCAPPYALFMALIGLSAALANFSQGAPPAAPAAPAGLGAATGPGPAAGAAACLATGDGYLRARLGGAIEANVDWPNSGTRCEGGPRDKPPGVRLSFRRAHGGKTDLLFVFGITGVREGQPAHEAGVNLTIIVQGTSRIYGTLGDSRCTVDSLTQRPLGQRGLDQRRPDKGGSYRVEARGFCTQPAHAVRGEGAVLVSTFEFAGLVTYDAQD